MNARDRLRAIDHELLLLSLERNGVRGKWDPAPPERREVIDQQMAALKKERAPLNQAAKQEQEVKVSRDKARAMRKEFRQKFDAVAARYAESQSDRFPVEYRERQGAAILKELSVLDAALSRDMLLWHHAQKVEAARLRASDPLGDPATETRRLREHMEADRLAEQYPSRTQARNILMPEASRLLDAGNLDAARVYLTAAKKLGADTSMLDHEVDRILDRTVPHRRQAVEIEVMAADEMELARRDAAAVRLNHKIGTTQELARASTTVQMADYKRQREAPVLVRELGIELPTSTD